MTCLIASPPVPDSGKRKAMEKLIQRQLVSRCFNEIEFAQSLFCSREFKYKLYIYIYIIQLRSCVLGHILGLCDPCYAVSPVGPAMSGKPILEYLAFIP